MDVFLLSVGVLAYFALGMVTALIVRYWPTVEAEATIGEFAFTIVVWPILMIVGGFILIMRAIEWLFTNAFFPFADAAVLRLSQNLIDENERGRLVQSLTPHGPQRYLRVSDSTGDHWICVRREHETVDDALAWAMQIPKNELEYVERV